MTKNTEHAGARRPDVVDRATWKATRHFQGREELLVYKHMFRTARPIEQQCPGCTIATWHVKDTAPYLNGRSVSLAFVSEGPWAELAPFVEFIGYTQTWYSTAGVSEPAVGGEMGSLACFLRERRPDVGPDESARPAVIVSVRAGHRGCSRRRRIRP